MRINPVRSEQSKKQAKEIAKTSAQVGATATGLTVLLAKDEIMPALKNTIAGKDRFVSKAKDAAVKTMKETGKTFDLNQIAQNADEMYHVFPEQLKSFAKPLAKQFLSTTLMVAAGLTVAKVVIDKTIGKQDKQ